MKHQPDCTKGPHCECDPPEPDPNDPIDDGYDPDLVYEMAANRAMGRRFLGDHRLAAEVGGHPVIPLPVHWRMGAHGDPIAVFDHITLHLWPDGSVTWKDETESHEVIR